MSIHFPLAQALFTHTDAVIAMGGDPNSLRAWMRRDGDGQSKVILRTTNPEGGWRRYSFEDIAMLVVIRVLTDFGVPVDIANKVADWSLPRASSLTPIQFVDLLKTYMLVGERTRGDLVPVSNTETDRIFSTGELAGHRKKPETKQAERWRFRIAQANEALPPSAIRIDLNAVVATAYELADESFAAGEDMALAAFNEKSGRTKKDAPDE